MKQILYILIGISTLLVACTNENQTKKELIRVVFDPGNLQFISNSMNPKNRTMSALYGNSEAVSSLTTESAIPKANSIFKLATFRYHENPQYFGGNITGELIKVETIEVNNKQNISYQIKDSTSTTNNPSNSMDRVKYIMSYKILEIP